MAINFQQIKSPLRITKACFWARILYFVLNNVAGGSRKTSRMAGNAAARAVRIIKGSDIPSVAQSTPNIKVQPNDCRLIT